MLKFSSKIMIMYGKHFLNPKVNEKKIVMKRVILYLTIKMYYIIFCIFRTKIQIFEICEKNYSSECHHNLCYFIQNS